MQILDLIREAYETTSVMFLSSSEYWKQNYDCLRDMLLQRVDRPAR